MGINAFIGGVTNKPIVVNRRQLRPALAALQALGDRANPILGQVHVRRRNGFTVQTFRVHSHKNTLVFSPKQ